jgi:hypothetical protein
VVTKPKSEKQRNALIQQSYPPISAQEYAELSASLKQSAELEIHSTKKELPEVSLFETIKEKIKDVFD